VTAMVQSGSSLSARAWLALGTVYIVWGSTYLGIALAGETIPPVFAAGLRFLLAGALMGGFVALRRGGLAPFRVRRDELGSAALVGVLLLGANALLFVAERRIPIGLASLLIASVPLWIVLMRTATGDRPKRVALVGVATGFAGIAVLVRPTEAASLLGILLVLGSAFVWATGSFLSSKLPLPEDPFVATTLEMLAGGALLLPIGLAFPGAESLDPATWSWRSLVGLVYLVLIGSLVGYTAYVWLLGNLPISTVATYAYVNPVVAILLGVIFLDEGVSWQILVGAAVVLVSVALVIRSEAERVREPFAE
jgi:drug/metabolite transporter (DMT)-like permease